MAGTRRPERDASGRLSRLRLVPGLCPIWRRDIPLAPDMCPCRSQDRVPVLAVRRNGGAGDIARIRWLEGSASVRLRRLFLAPCLLRRRDLFPAPGMCPGMCPDLYSSHAAFAPFAPAAGLVRMRLCHVVNVSGLLDLSSFGLLRGLFPGLFLISLVIRLCLSWGRILVLNRSQMPGIVSWRL